jgi:hypothetical protein
MLMQMIERIGHGHEQGHRPARRYGSLALQKILDRAARHELGNQVEKALLFTKIVNLNNVWVTESGDDASLALKSIAAHRVVLLIHGRQQLDGYMAIQGRLVGSPDHTHAATPHKLLQNDGGESRIGLELNRHGPHVWKYLKPGITTQHVRRPGQLISDAGTNGESCASQ